MQSQPLSRAQIEKDRRPLSVYVLPCPCGATVESHQAETRCGNCGLTLVADFRNENGMDNRK
jgi:hypothetical protein